MADKKKSKKKAKKNAHTVRLWLMYPQKLLRKPIIYELGHEFDVITNVRQATVHDDAGLISIELEGRRTEIDKAIAWLEKLGVKVEPVEMNVIAG